MKIDWQVPASRSGFKGKIDSFIGPGATSAEKNIQSYIPLLAGGLLIFSAYVGEFDWHLSQYLVALILTLDMVGGVITNATASAKRWYHREGEGFKQHMAFIMVHFVQLGFFSGFFLDFNLVWIALVGGYMLFASTLILLTPLYLQRPVALTLYCVSLLLSLYVFESVAGLEWFLPVFYLKLLISHLLKEAPFCPEKCSNPD